MSNFKFFLIICAILFSNNLFGNDTLCPIDSFLQKTEEIQYEDIDNALHQVEMIIDNFSQDSDTSCIIELYHQYALRNGTQGNYFLVFNALWKALLLADKAKLEKEQFYLNLDIGRFYSYLKRYEKADNHFKIASKLKDSLLIKNEITNIKAVNFYSIQVTMYQIKGDTEMAKVYLDSCYWQLEQADVPSKNYYIEYKRAIYLIDNEQYKQALAILKEVVEFMKIDNPGYLTIIYSDIGNIYRSLSEYEKSLEAYQNALNNFELHKRHADYLPKVYERLAELNYEIGNYKAAYEMSVKQEELDFELFDSRSERNSYLMNVQDDFRLYKEQEQERARKQELTQLKQYQRLLLFQRLLLIASVLFLCLLGFIYSKLQKGKIKVEKALNHQLQKQNLEKEQFLKRIEKKNEELVTFSNIMAHDLKAPLYNISAFAGLVKNQIEKGFHKERVLKYVNFIDNSAESMTALIQDLLLYSKIDLEECDFSNVYLNDLVTLVLPAFSYEINAGNVIVNVKELPIIHGNKSLLRTVFHNLISNAVKYQPKDKPNHQIKVDIWAVEEAHQHCIFIQDNGIGIEPEHADKLFKPFVRFHSSKEYSGTGLGMSICERIMTNHEGSVQLDHTSNEGSRFKLTFPKIENGEMPVTTTINSAETL